MSLFSIGNGPFTGPKQRRKKVNTKWNFSSLRPELCQRVIGSTVQFEVTIKVHV